MRTMVHEYVLNSSPKEIHTGTLPVLNIDIPFTQIEKKNHIITIQQLEAIQEEQISGIKCDRCKRDITIICFITVIVIIAMLTIKCIVSLMTFPSESLV